MKKFLFLLLPFCLNVHAKMHTVLIEGMKYTPESLDVQVGDTVEWSNNDIVIHTVTALDKSFNSKNISADQKWKYTAKKKGTFPYRCLFHKPMKGTLRVN